MGGAGKGWSAVYTVEALLDLLDGGQYTPDRAQEELPDPFLSEARNPGGDASRSEDCDDQAGENVSGNITYMPRERFRPGNDGCRATGITADFSSPEDAMDGTKTITKWKPDCETGATVVPYPADYWNLTARLAPKREVTWRAVSSADPVRTCGTWCRCTGMRTPTS
ncbi:hypothetical protein GCM10010231_45250 [Streptomyces sindenensis]|nr:hypothetical protein GCM10010231_45250 [Streptomyces sindenensis]